LRQDRIARWRARGAWIGGIGWILFEIGLHVVVALRPANPARPVDSGLIAASVVLGLILMVPLGAGLGASAAVLVDTLRPIVLAIVDAKKYEQEYGATASPASPATLTGAENQEDPPGPGMSG
jgi:hypothetical protein